MNKLWKDPILKNQGAQGAFSLADMYGAGLCFLRRQLVGERHSQSQHVRIEVHVIPICVLSELALGSAPFARSPWDVQAAAAARRSHR